MSSSRSAETRAAPFLAIDHAVVVVADLPRARRDTAILLGRAPSFEGTHPGLGTRNALFRTGGHYLELLAAEGRGAGARFVEDHLAARGPGLAALALRAASLAQALPVLRSRGIAVPEPMAGLGRDEESGAFRRWRSVLLPVSETRGLPLLAIEHLSPPELLPEAPPRGSAAACAAGLDHVVVRSRDLDAARRLFADRLGLRLALDRSFPELGLRMLFFRLGGVTLEVVGAAAGAGPATGPRPEVAPAPDPAAEPDPGAEAEDRDAFYGLAWRVPDADAARERLVGEGFDVSPVRPGRKPGTRVATVRSRTSGVPTLLIGPDPGTAASAGPAPR